MKTLRLFACLLVVSLATTASAQLCAPGSSSPTGNAPCTLCPIGFFSANFGALVCTACTEGRYSDVEGSTSCNLCLAGTFSLAGSAACSVCPDGFIAPVIGSASCQPCPPGFTSNPSHTACVPTSVPTLERTWGFVRQLYK